MTQPRARSNRLADDQPTAQTAEDHAIRPHPREAGLPTFTRSQSHRAGEHVKLDAIRLEDRDLVPAGERLEQLDPRRRDVPGITSSP